LAADLRQHPEQFIVYLEVRAIALVIHSDEKYAWLVRAGQGVRESTDRFSWILSMPEQEDFHSTLCDSMFLSRAAISPWSIPSPA
jgi:hypothetical protein